MSRRKLSKLQVHGHRIPASLLGFQRGALVDRLHFRHIRVEVATPAVGGGRGAGVVLPPIIPQIADDLGGRHVVGVVGDQTQQERPVVPQIMPHELLDELSLVQTDPRSPTQLQMILDELQLVVEGQGSDEPDQEAGACHCGHSDQPEPDEHVDLLVVHVDRKDALDRVILDVAEVLPSDGEVAIGDSREGDVAIFGPVSFCGELAQHIDSERVVPGGQDGAQTEQLEQPGGDVADLRDEKQCQQVTAIPGKHEQIEFEGDSCKVMVYSLNSKVP